MKGKLIVFEGTDGSGKATQTKLLCDRLLREGVPFRKIDFPRYGNPFAQPAERYLNGDLGSNPGDVNAYAASTFYAVDRYASYRQDWGNDYENGMLILADRYTTSNALHQSAKLPEGERLAFLEWLFHFEYDLLELPKPDCVVYLDLPAEISTRLLRQREESTGTHADIHERDAGYLARCHENAAFVAAHCGWERISCANGALLRPAEELAEEIYRRIAQPVLFGDGKKGR